MSTSPPYPCKKRRDKGGATAQRVTFSTSRKAARPFDFAKGRSGALDHFADEGTRATYADYAAIC